MSHKTLPPRQPASPPPYPPLAHNRAQRNPTMGHHSQPYAAPNASSLALEKRPGQLVYLLLEAAFEVADISCDRGMGRKGEG